MSDIVASFDPGVATTTAFTAPQGAANGALVFWNESNISLNLTFQDGSVMYLPAWYNRHKCGASGNVNISWDIRTVLSSNNPPISEIIVEAYQQGEHFPPDGSLVRQTNTGNIVTTSQGATLSIQNDGNAAGTSIVEATPVGDGSPAVQLSNSGVLVLGNATHTGSISSDNGKFATDGSGNLTVKGHTSLDNGALTTDGGGNINKWAGTLQVSGTVPALSVGSSKTRVQAPTGGSVNIQIPAASDVLVATSTGVTVTGTATLDSGAITTDGSGNITKWAGVLQVDGSNPALSVGSNKTRVQAANTGSINLQVPGGSDVAVVTNGAFTLSQQLTLSGVGITWKTNDTISGTHTFTGTTTGTYTHGAGGTPFIIIPMTDVVGSQNMGYDTVTSTQVHITSGAGLGFKALTILG